MILTKLQRSPTAAARALARPAPDGTFTAELARAGSLPHRVGHDYRNVRLIPDRTFTGCSARFVGCTSNQIKVKNLVPHAKDAKGAKEERFIFIPWTAMTQSARRLRKCLTGGMNRGMRGIPNLAAFPSAYSAYSAVNTLVAASPLCVLCG